MACQRCGSRAAPPTYPQHARGGPARGKRGAKDFPDHFIDERITTALSSRINWVLIGGPRCQAYSIVGRSRIIGKKGRAAYTGIPATSSTANTSASSPPTSRPSS